MELIDTETELVVAKVRWWGVGKIDKGCQKLQTSSYKINKSWGDSVQHGNHG